MGRAVPAFEDPVRGMPLTVGPAATKQQLAQARMTCLHVCCANPVLPLPLLHGHDEASESLPG